MGKRGPKPKPTALDNLEGNPSRRARSPDEPQPPVLKKDVPPPAILNEDGKAEWVRLSPILRGLGLLTRADLPALTIYCAAWSRWTEAERELNKEGASRLVRTPNKHVQASPWLTISRQNAELCVKVLAEFGLTPSSRSRVTAIPGMGAPPAGPENEPAVPAEIAGSFHGLIGKQARRPN